MSDPLYQNAQGIVNAAGTVILPFPSPGTGYAWTGTVNVPNAIGNEKWQVQVGNAGSGLPWGTFLGNSPFGPVQALDSAVISITGTGLTPGTIYTAVLIGSIDPKSSAPTAMPQPQPLTLAQIASTINAAVSGAVTANMPQASMSGSPANWNNAPAIKNFTWPVGGPYSSVTMTVFGATFTQVTVTGLTTGRVYLSEVIDGGEWKLPISSLVEPAGFSVNAARAYGYTGTWNFQAALVATVSPDIVAPVYGPAAQGPTNFADGLVTSTGTLSVGLVGGGRSTTVRVWSAWISMCSNPAANIVLAGYIGYSGGNILTCALGSAVSAQGNNSVSLDYEGGLVVPIGNAIAPLSLLIDSSANAAVFARGGIAYSLDSA